jgi:hypothetical protein
VQEYIRHLIFDVLADGSIVEVLRKLMKLPWGEAEPYLLKCLLKVCDTAAGASLTARSCVLLTAHSCAHVGMQRVCIAGTLRGAGKGTASPVQVCAQGVLLQIVVCCVSARLCT